MRPRARASTTSTRIVPWQPASTTALDGSISTAKSAASSSGSVVGDPAEPVAVGLDLLALVEDVGHVAVGRGERSPPAAARRPRRPSCRRCRGRDAVAVDPATGGCRCSGTVSMWPAIDDPLGPAEVGARDDRCRRAGRPRGGRAARSAASIGVGDRPLVAADRLDVDQRRVSATSGQVGRSQHVGHPVGRSDRRHGVASIWRVRPSGSIERTRRTRCPPGRPCTCQPISSSGGRSSVAPASTSASTSAALTSQCMRFLTVLGSGTGTNVHGVERQLRRCSSSHQILVLVALRVAPRRRPPTTARSRRGVRRVDDELVQPQSGSVRLAHERTELAALGIGHHRPPAVSPSGSSNVAPSAEQSSIEPAWTSRCTRFFTVFGSGTVFIQMRCRPGRRR